MTANPSRIGLTRRQAEILDVIRAAGRPLGYSELAKRAGLCSRGSAHNMVAPLRERGHVVTTRRGVAPAGLNFIPIGTRGAGDAPPTAATDRYPFLSHMTCAEWGDRSLHGQAA